MLDIPILHISGSGIAKGDNLGQFEQQAPTALMLLGVSGKPYGMTIHMKMEELAEGKTVAIGAVYTTLDRLEAKGYVRFWYSDPTEERGNRAKRYFEITGSGESALN